MSKIIFNEHQRRILEANPNVKEVSDRVIHYTSEFKVKAVKENLEGKGLHKFLWKTDSTL